MFCQLFAACEHAQDVTRADAWIRVGEAVAERRNLPAVSAFCRTHYGGVLTAAGRWPEAEAAVVAAVQLWGLGDRAGLRAGALVRLADLRLRQGRFEEAEQLLVEVVPADAASAEAARPRAAALLARGEPELDAGGSWSGRWPRRRPPPRPGGAPAAGRCSSTSTSRRAGRTTRLRPPTPSARVLAAGALCQHDVHAAAALAQERACLGAGHRRPEGLPAPGAGRVRPRLDAGGAGPARPRWAAVRGRPTVAVAEARTALAAFERLRPPPTARTRRHCFARSGGGPGRRAPGRVG